MNHLICWILGSLLVLSTSTHAQTSNATHRDTIPAGSGSTTSADDLLSGLTDSTEAAPLLPRHMIFTQRAFWGPKGLLRVTNAAPLTPEGRTKELKIRRGMLRVHQVAGFVTLAGFVAQGIIGAKLYSNRTDNYQKLHELHENTATAINIAYTTTALLSLTAPPKAIDERRGFSSIKAHKYLAVLHIAGMVATNILANQLEGNSAKIKPYHRAAAYTTFGAFAASIIAIKF